MSIKNTAPKKVKYLLMWDRIGDYHRARWQALAQIVGNENVFAADLGAADNLYKWENTAAENPQYRLLSVKPVLVSDKWNRLRNFYRLVRQQNIDVIAVPGYGRPEYILMLLLSRLMGKKVVLFAESWYGHHKLLNTFKGILLRITCNGFLVSGVRASSHFHENLGVPLKRIKIGYSVVDNDHFGSQHSIAKTDLPTILCVARFSPEKNLSLLIAAFMRSEIQKVYKLKIVGGGPLLQQLQKEAQGSDKIELDNWLTYKELPSLYAQANLFILPSSFEPWGLVVNEAMSAGLPLILSEACGCLPELLDEQNGFAFDEKNEEELVNIFNQIAQMPLDKLQQMGLHSKQKIRSFSPSTWANSLIELAN